VLFYSIIDRSNKLATVKEEEKKVSYHIITGELRDKIGTLLMKQAWVDVHEVMKVLINLASVNVEQNEKDQKELQFEESEKE
jgi:Fe-S cluster biosynthesis and repair protein YggX|tara:strand:- start:1381 stop:1626 length:246 start_codon:yes stop_codon:yes gene_type:complete